MIHDRHYSRDEAQLMLPRVKPVLQKLRDAKDLLTDEEAHEVLTEAAPANGGGEQGRQVGEAFLEVRRLLGALQEAGIDTSTQGTLFSTTELFLERLGLSSLEELPALAPLLPDVDAIDEL